MGRESCSGESWEVGEEQGEHCGLPRVWEQADERIQADPGCSRHRASDEVHCGVRSVRPGPVSVGQPGVGLVRQSHFCLPRASTPRRLVLVDRDDGDLNTLRPQSYNAACS